MKHSIFLPIFFALFLASSLFDLFLVNLSLAEAEPSAASRRGLITTGACPLTCSDLGVAAEFCRETRMGSKCSVEDLSQPAGHRSLARVPRGLTPTAAPVRKAVPMPSKAMMSDELAADAPINDPTRRGLVTTTNCPFTCAEAGVPAGFCRERQVGNSCQVEDLRQPPGHRSMVRVR